MQTKDKRGAGYNESCKSGSGASARKPDIVICQGAGYLAYSGKKNRSIRITTELYVSEKTEE